MTPLALSIANGVIIMFEAQNLFYGFILLFIGVVLCSFGFTSLYAERLEIATFIVFIIILVVFLSEVFYLATSQIYWFYIIPEFFSFAFVIIVAAAIIYEHIKKHRVKPKNTQ